MKKIICIIFLIIMTSSVLGVGIQSKPFIPNPMIFEPGFTVTKSYSVYNYGYDVNIGLGGDLAEFAVIHDIIDSGTSQSFQMTLTLPDKIDEPGIHKLYVQASEVAPPGGGIMALTVVRKLIQILVLYDEKVLRFNSFTSPHVNENETVDFVVNTESLSKQNISNVFGDITIYNYDGEIVRKMKTPAFTIPSGETKSESVEFDSTGLPPGQYSAEVEMKSGADVAWENGISTFKNNFNIGTLEIDILNITTINLTAGQINKIGIKIESKWKGQTNAYAKLYINDIENSATQTYTLGPFETKELTGYLDLITVDGGNYVLRVDLHYEEETTSAEKNIEVIGKIDKEPISMITIMMILLVLILVLVIIVLIVEQRKKK